VKTGRTEKMNYLGKGELDSKRLFAQGTTPSERKSMIIGAGYNSYVAGLSAYLMTAAEHTGGIIGSEINLAFLGKRDPACLEEITASAMINKGCLDVRMDRDKLVPNVDMAARRMRLYGLSPG
jgi:hypothetical protein